MTTRSRTPLVLSVVLAVVAIAAVAAVVLVRGTGDDGGDDDSVSTVPELSGTDAAGSAGVEVDGTALPTGQGADDPAIGTPAPALSGFDYSGQAVAVTPGADGPALVVFLAHWCPHCNNEVPVLNEWKASGAVPADLNVVGVSTAVSAERPNYPPGQWLADKGWDWPVIADDAELSAAKAYGLTAFPYLTFIDADGNVVARVSGEIPVEQIQTLADATVAAA